jgi:MFS family permease
MSRNRTFALLGALYVSQYLGIGFFYTALVAILRERGVPLGQLSAVQLIGLVWGVKFLWAPLLDRYGSHRGWLLVLQPAIVVGLLAIVPLDPVADFPTLLLLAGAVAGLSATQDIAADAIAAAAAARSLPHRLLGVSRAAVRCWPSWSAAAIVVASIRRPFELPEDGDRRAVRGCRAGRLAIQN